MLTLLLLACALLTLLGVFLALVFLGRLRQDLQCQAIAREERTAEQQIRQLSWAALQRMLAEARRAQESAR